MGIDVNTSSGSVRGQTLHVLNRKIHQFLNIPYAKPPLGPFRFAPPVPLKAPKEGIIDDTKVGNSCIQSLKSRMNSDNIMTISEDCLVLNIWTPNTASSGPKGVVALNAVMFYIYGGGLYSGTIFHEYLNGSLLATNGVVLVAANYRVGPLGFLYGGGDQTAPGNAGFYDQLLALKWIRENIDLFGGDKDRITIFGMSAGSWSVSAHILSPLSKGLFKRAIMQSGSVMHNRDRPALSTVEALQRAKQLTRRLNCDEFDYKWLDCLRAIDDPNLFVETPVSGHIGVTHAVFGTEFLPRTVKDEGTMFAPVLYRPLKPDITEHQFRGIVANLSAEYHNIDVDKVCDHYLNGVHKTNSSQLKAELSALYGDLVFTCPTYRFAKSYANSGRNAVYFYRFNFKSQFLAKQYGCVGGDVCHALDVPFVWGSPLSKPHEVWPQFWDKSVIRVKDLNPNDMSVADIECDDNSPAVCADKTGGQQSVRICRAVDCE
ncbi:unnamed protein product, partial [Medioppia subpectinata]